MFLSDIIDKILMEIPKNSNDEITICFKDKIEKFKNIDMMNIAPGYRWSVLCNIILKFNSHKSKDEEWFNNIKDLFGIKDGG